MSTKPISHDVSYAQVFQGRQLLNRLAVELLPLDDSLAVTRDLRRIEGPGSDFDTERNKLLKKHTKTTATGEPEPDAQGQAQFKSADDEIAFNTALNTLLAKTVEVAVEPIRLSSLPKGFLLSAVSIMALTPWLLIDDASDEAAEAEASVEAVEEVVAE